MALKQDFYSDIFLKEEYWTEIAKENLLNIYYLDNLKEFYLDKKNELEKELELSNNTLIKSFLNMIQNIISQIDIVTDDYKSGKNININSVIKLFLSNQMNNNFNYTNVDEKSESSNIPALQAKIAVLQALRKDLESTKNKVDDDYLYDNQKVA